MGCRQEYSQWFYGFTRAKCKYFANIASKDMYDPSELDHFRCDKSGDFQPLTNIEVEQLLRNTKLTAAGCGDIHAWLLRSCSFELADVVA